MFRKLTLLAVVTALVSLVSGDYNRLLGAELGGTLAQQNLDGFAWLKHWVSTTATEIPLTVGQVIHLTSSLLLAGLAILLFLLSGAQKHNRLAAMTASFTVLILATANITTGQWASELDESLFAPAVHYLLTSLILWTLSDLYLRLNPVLQLRKTQQTVLRIITSLAMLLVLDQIVLGCLVSAMMAGQACPDFPLCHGQWMPQDADFSAIADFFLGEWRQRIDYPVRLAAVWLHQVGALICFIVLTWVMLLATASSNHKSLRRWGLWLSLLLIIQLTLGILIKVLSLPLILTLAHGLFAALLMLPLIAIRLYCKYEKVLLEQPAIEAEAKKAIAEEAGRAIEPVQIEPESVLLRLKKQLHKTRSGLGGVLSTLSGRKIDEDLLEEVEASLLMADVGVDVTQEILQHLTENVDKELLDQPDGMLKALKQYLYEILEPVSQPLEIPEQDTPFVILVVGVNGAGKTTTIGKLAKRLQNQGHSVMLAAGDTFRAAAVEQLETWGERNNIQVVAQHTGADSASVIFDAVQSAQAKGVDVLIADTAGRLHTKSNLMEELSKIKRIMARLDENAPHEVLLVLDAGTGQNALSQAQLFNEAVQLTGIALTKLDGTAKGGVIFALARKIGVPIRFIGVGEGIDDLQDFDAGLFIDALFEQD